MLAFKLPANHRPSTTFNVSDNQFGRPHPSDSWASCLLSTLLSGFSDILLIRLVWLKPEWLCQLTIARHWRMAFGNEAIPGTRFARFSYCCVVRQCTTRCQVSSDLCVVLYCLHLYLNDLVNGCVGKMVCKLIWNHRLPTSRYSWRLPPVFQ